MRISQLAARSGVPATTLRYYESAGLLSAERSPAGYRLYGDAAVDRLAFIGAAKGLGLPLAEIAELLGVWQQGACREVRADLRPRVLARLADAEERQAELAAFADSLRRSLAQLDTLPDRETPCDPACGFLDAGPSAAPALPAPPPAPAPAAACSLTGDETEARTAQWRALLDGGTRTELPGTGVRWALPAERAGELARLAVEEQCCCPFLAFRMQMTGRLVYLEVRAPEAGAGWLAELFG